MRKITVDKAQLIEQVTKNLAEHKETYAEAIKIYWQELSKWHAKQAETAAAEEDPEQYPADLPKPRSHEKDYEQALAMLSWDKADTADLDDTLFRRLVLNEWDWSRDFIGATSLYLGS